MRAALVGLLLSSTAFAAAGDVDKFVAIATDTKVQLRWIDVGTLQTGAIVVRSTAPHDTAPNGLATYSVGNSIGNGTVRYVEISGVGNQAFQDTGLTNGTKYYYKVYSRFILAWSSGNVPTSVGLTATPRAATGNNARWCYAMGASAVMQPVVDPGVGVYFAGNGGTINATITTPGVAGDGDERWRPATLNGTVQGRFPVLTLFNGTKTILTGDSTGRAYAYNATTGASVWNYATGGDAIIAQPAVQLRQYANAAFQSANTTNDLVFVATRNASTTTNKVVALNSITGAVKWTYAPGDLDQINGGMFVDYVNNRLYVASRSKGNTQQSLRILDSLTGSKLYGFSLGDIDTGAIRNPSANQVFVINTSGVFTAIDISTVTTAYTQSIGIPNSWLFPAGLGFIVSLSSGAVERWAPANTTTFARTWTTAITNPTGPNLEFVSQTVWVGSTDGKLHQLRLDTGVDQLQIDLADDAVGTPSIDTTSQRLHVGTLGGHVCAIPLP